MTTATQVSVEEYLTTVYEPDVDYLDGELEERNVGEYDHNNAQLQSQSGFADVPGSGVFAWFRSSEQS